MPERLKHRFRFSTWLVPLCAITLQFASARPTVAEDAVLLRYKAAPGDRQIYRSRTEMKQTQRIGELDIEQKLTAEQTCSRTVLAVDERGLMQLKLKNERLTFEGTFGPSGEYQFDSTSDERDTASVLGAALTPVFERLSDGAFQVAVSPRGEVTEAKGLAEMLGDLLENNPIAVQLTSGGSDAAAKFSVQDQFVVLPENPVRPGDTWEVPWEIALPKLGTTKGKKSFRFLGLDKTGPRPTARIECTTEMSFDVNIDMGDARVTGTAAVTSSSCTIRFDVAAGRLSSSVGTVRLAGDLIVTTGGQSIAIKTDQTQKTTIELLDKLPETAKKKGL